MTFVLLRLLLLSLRGRVLRSARQLRQPKYLIGFVLGVGWMLFWLGSFGVQSFSHMRFVGGAAFDQFGGEAGEILQLVAAAGVALLFTSGWLLPFGRLALPLKEAELHLLLPAPLSRRQIIHYALLKAQIPIAFTALVFTMLRGSGSNRLVTFLSIWLIFMLIDLHGKWRAMSVLRLRQVSRAARRGWWVAIYGILLAFWAYVIPRAYKLGFDLYEAASREPISLEDGGIERLMSRVAEVVPDPALSVVLTPFRWITGPLFAEGTVELIGASVPALAILVLLHEGIVRSRARFEEVSFVHAQKLAASKSPTRRYTRLSSGSRQRSPFPLPPAGRPELAVLWKNLMQVSRIPLSRIFLFAGGFLALLAIVPAVLEAHDAVFVVITFTGMITLAMMPWISAIAFRNDMRGELAMIDLVRTFPLSAHRLVLAAVMSPALLGTLLAVLAAGLITAGVAGVRLRMLLHGLTGPDTPLYRISETLGQPMMLTLLLILAAVLPLSAASALLCASLNNLGTLMFPAWVGVGPSANKGMAAMGQRLLFAMALGLALMIAVVPGVVLVALAGLAIEISGVGFSAWLFPPLGLLAALPMFGESWLIIRGAAGLWQRLDPSQELLEAGR